MTRRFPTAPSFALSLLSASLLLACGGGGDTSSAETLTDQTAAGYAANASVVGSDAASALDATLLTATDLVSASATTQSTVTGREQAQAITVGPLQCGDGGTASLTVNGATPQAEANGQLDIGEIYAVTFTNCRRAAGAPTLNGVLSMTVGTVTANGATVTITSGTQNPLSVTLQRGIVTFNGSVTVARSVSVTGNNSTVSTQVTSASLAVTTQFNGRTGNFTLSNVNLNRLASHVSGVVQSSSYNGSHTLSAVLPNLSYSYDVATNGGFNANGVPNQGSWVITLPRRTITVTINEALATIAVDDGNNGSIDRSITVPVAQLGSDAG